jgi:hypothetical protein
MTWLSLKTFLMKVWALCKKYWQILVGISIPLIVWLATRNRERLDAVLDRANQAHSTDIAAIDQSHAIEQAAAEQAQVNYQNTVAQIEQEHDEAQVSLDDRKKKRIRQIVRQYKDSPEEITRRIAALTGLHVRGR